MLVALFNVGHHFRQPSLNTFNRIGPHRPQTIHKFDPRESTHLFGVQLPREHQHFEVVWRHLQVLAQLFDAFREDRVLALVLVRLKCKRHYKKSNDISLNSHLEESVQPRIGRFAVRGTHGGGAFTLDASSDSRIKFGDGRRRGGDVWQYGRHTGRSENWSQAAAQVITVAQLGRVRWGAGRWHMTRRWIQTGCLGHFCYKSVIVNCVDEIKEGGGRNWISKLYINCSGN